VSDPLSRRERRPLLLVLALVIAVPVVSVGALAALLAMPDAIALPLSLAGLAGCLCVPWALRRSAARQAVSRVLEDAQRVPGGER
jgi:hypothetical protein